MFFFKKNKELLGKYYDWTNNSDTGKNNIHADILLVLVGFLFLFFVENTKKVKDLYKTPFVVLSNCPYSPLPAQISIILDIEEFTNNLCWKLDIVVAINRIRKLQLIPTQSECLIVLNWGRDGERGGGRWERWEEGSLNL